MGHHHEPFEVPHYSIYNNWHESPHLVQHQKRLQRLGLRDNWLMRNGLFTGFGLATAMITAEELYSYAKTGHTSWNAEH